MLSKSLASDILNNYTRTNYDNVNSNKNYVPFACKSIMNSFTGPIYNEYITKINDIAYSTMILGLKSSRFVGNRCIQNGITYLKSNDKILNQMECTKYKCDKCHTAYATNYCNGYCDWCDQYQNKENMYSEKYQWDFSILKSLLECPGGFKLMITCPIESQHQFIYKSLDDKDHENTHDNDMDTDTHDNDIDMDESHDDDDDNDNNIEEIVTIKSELDLIPNNHYDFHIRGKRRRRKNWRYSKKREYICISEEYEEYDEPNPIYMSYGLSFTPCGISAFVESSQYDDQASTLDNEYECHFKRINDYNPKYNGVTFQLQHKKFVALITTGSGDDKETIQRVNWPSFPIGSYHLNLEVADNNRIELVSFKQIG